MRVIRTVLFFVLLCLACVAASAQRQTPGRPSLDGYVSFGNTAKGFGVAGGGVAWCNYDYAGRTSIGVDVLLDRHRYVEKAVYDKSGELVYPEETHLFGSYDVCAAGGYFIRLLAPRSRSVILSAGGTLLAGVKYCKPMASFYKDDSGDKAYSSVGFLLCIVPEAQLEVFLLRSASLYASVRPRAEVVNGLGGKSDWFKMTYAAGVKVYL